MPCAWASGQRRLEATMSQTQTARLMDGTGLARRIVEETSGRAAELARRTGVTPCLATVLVGEDPASVTYVRMKRARCAKAGIESRLVALPADHDDRRAGGRRSAPSRRTPACTASCCSTRWARTSTSGRRSRPSRRQKDVDGVTMSSFARDELRTAGLRIVHPGRDHAAAGRVRRRARGQARRGRGPQRDPRQAGRNAPARPGRHRDLLPLPHRGPVRGRAGGGRRGRRPWDGPGSSAARTSSRARS